MILSSPGAVFALALVLSLAFTPLFRGVALRWGVVDRPNARSSHQRVVPRAGGTAIALAVHLAFALARPAWAAHAAAVPVLLGGVALALIGLADDRAGLSAFTRLVAQLGVAGLVVVSVGGFERVPLLNTASLHHATGETHGGASWSI